MPKKPRNHAKQVPAPLGSSLLTPELTEHAKTGLPPLSVAILCDEARAFGNTESQHEEPSLYGVTDGKAVGTYLEHKFTKHLLDKYTLAQGNSAKGIDFPSLNVDMKVTSIAQPQSSCPFKSARQKVYGLGYSLLVFVYEKRDDRPRLTSCLNIVNVVFIEEDQTADHGMTMAIDRYLKSVSKPLVEEVIAILQDRMLPVDEIEAEHLAQEIISNHPKIGYLTISNALQWRLQYGRAIEKAGAVSGVRKIL